MKKTKTTLLFTFMVIYCHTAESGNFTFAETSAIGQKLLEAPDNSWIRVNENKFNEVWRPESLRPNTLGGPYSIIQAWGSMAWDSNRGDLIFYGGGHGNYAGNEVYRWRASSLKWERASLPSQIKRIAGSPPHPDYTAIDGVFNAPVAAHTYDNNEYLPIADRFVTFGGAAYNTGATFRRLDGARTGPYFWDPSKADANKVGGTTGSQVDSNILGGNMWQNRNNLSGFANSPQQGGKLAILTNGATAYTEENGKDVLFVQSKNDLYKYTVNDVNDPLSDTYELVGIAWKTFNGKGAGAYSPSQNLFLRSSGNTKNFNYWQLDLSGAGNRNTNFVPTVLGEVDFDFEKLGEYGMEFDSVRNRFLLWGGDSDVWALTPPEDLANFNEDWTLELLSGIAEGEDGLPSLADIGTFTGVLGKWKYSEELDVFLGVVDPVKGDVWAYKPDNWLASNVPIPASFYFFFASILLLFAKNRRTEK